MIVYVWSGRKPHNFKLTGFHEAQRSEIPVQRLVLQFKYLHPQQTHQTCLLEQKFVKDPDRRVREVINDSVAKLGENIKVRRFQRYQLWRD